MFKKWLCHAKVSLIIECIDPVLVKAGYATVDGPDSVPISSYRGGENPEYFLPGSSLKGAIRAHAERIIRTLKPKMTCVPYESDRDDPDNDLYISCSKRLEQLKNKNDESSHRANRELRNKHYYYRLQCPVCRTFGSTAFAGKLSIADAWPVAETKPVVESRDGVGIDRFTGGAARGAKFEYTAIVSGKFETTISVTNFELWQLGILQAALEDLKNGMIRIGSGKSRGLGRVKAGVTEYAVTYPFAVERLVGIERLVTESEVEEYGLFTNNDVDIALPTPTVIGLQHIYDITALEGQMAVSLVKCFRDFIDSGYPGDWLTAITAAAKEG